MSRSTTEARSASVPWTTTRCRSHVFRSGSTSFLPGVAGISWGVDPVLAASFRQSPLVTAVPQPRISAPIPGLLVYAQSPAFRPSVFLDIGESHMPAIVLIGAQWGDEGKG